MISTAEALDKLLDLVTPLAAENVSLFDAAGRVLVKSAVSRRAQPPFSASAMDGYGIAVTAPNPGDMFDVIGEAAAGHRYDGNVTGSQAIRIFTGAPVPNGVKRIVIQEDTDREGDTITLKDNIDRGFHIRPAGGDFDIGATLDAPRRLSPSNVALLASMNCAEVQVARKPKVALIATGDELVMPGESPREDQIIASNSFGIAALLKHQGAEVRLLPIAKDTVSSLAFALSLAEDTDLIITIGGASVGDHDLVAQVTQNEGLERAFYKVAMRPGKPLMSGRFGNVAMVGLPGNPVSSMVCTEIFILPMIDKMLGLPTGTRKRDKAILGHDLAKNGPREHYMRAKMADDGTVCVYDKQDSSLLSVLSDANVLVVRPPEAEALKSGSLVEIIRI